MIEILLPPLKWIAKSSVRVSVGVTADTAKNGGGDKNMNMTVIVTGEIPGVE